MRKTLNSDPLENFNLMIDLWVGYIDIFRTIDFVDNKGIEVVSLLMFRSKHSPEDYPCIIETSKLAKQEIQKNVCTQNNNLENLIIIIEDKLQNIANSIQSLISEKEILQSKVYKPFKLTISRFWDFYNWFNEFKLKIKTQNKDFHNNLTNTSSLKVKKSDITHPQQILILETFGIIKYLKDKYKFTNEEVYFLISTLLNRNQQNTKGYLTYISTSAIKVPDSGKKYIVTTSENTDFINKIKKTLGLTDKEE